MTSYVAIPNGDVDQDSPVTQPLMTALRDNPIAIAEGASGAPKIQTIALEPPTSATTYVIRRLQISEASTSVATYPSGLLNDRFSAEQHVGVTVLVPGSIYCYLEHRSGGTIQTSEVRILKNGVVLATWSTTSTTYVARSLTVSVAIGDSIIFQNRGASGTSYWQNLIVYSGNNNMAVA